MARPSKSAASRSAHRRSARMRTPKVHTTSGPFVDAVVTVTGTAPSDVDQPRTSTNAATSESSAPWQSSRSTFFGGMRDVIRGAYRLSSAARGTDLRRRVGTLASEKPRGCKEQGRGPTDEEP